MNILVSSFEVCLPLLLLVALGVVLRKAKVLSDVTIKEVSKLILNVFLPINMFMNLYSGDLEGDLTIRYVLLLVGIYFITLVINFLFVHFTVKDHRQKSAMLQNAVRANQTLFALPLTANIGGIGLSALTAVSCCIITPLNNVYCVSEFEYFENKNSNKWHIVLNVLKSPITIATALGFLCNIVGFILPNIVYMTFSYISRSVVAFSLVMVGASFNFAVNKEKISKIAYCVVFKTLICPAIAIFLALLFEMTGIQIITVMCLFAAPIATSSYPQAVGYDTDMDIVSSSLVYSYVASIITLPLIISIMQIIGLL